METLYKRCAGLDVHSETIVACVLTGDNDSSLSKEIETFPTLTKDLFRLLKWLEEHEVTHVAMESRGIYWKPVYNILEDFFDITLAMLNELRMYLVAKRMYQMPSGLPSYYDMGESKRALSLQKIYESFRDLTRLRKKWIGHMTSEKNRIQKVLEASNIKLGTMISDVFGVSGRRLLEHLMSEGYIDPEKVEEEDTW